MGDKEKAETGAKVVGLGAPREASLGTGAATELIKGTANAFGDATTAINAVASSIGTGKDPDLRGVDIEGKLKQGAKDAVVGGAKSSLVGGLVAWILSFFK
jgi:hypothetical protein